MTIREDLRESIVECLERIEKIKDPAIKNIAINGILNTIDDLVKTIEKEIK